MGAQRRLSWWNVSLPPGPELLSPEWAFGHGWVNHGELTHQELCAVLNSGIIVTYVVHYALHEPAVR